MASVVFSAPRSAENEIRVEGLRMSVKRFLENNPALVDGGLFIGSVMNDPAAAIRPTFCILVQCWEIAGDELHESAKSVMKYFKFEGLSVIGLE